MSQQMSRTLSIVTNADTTDYFLFFIGSTMNLGKAIKSAELIAA